MNEYIEAFNRIKEWDTPEILSVKKEIKEQYDENTADQVQASNNREFGMLPGEYTSIGSFGFDGEKVPGEIGTIKQYWLSYRRLSLRGWQAFLESDIAQATIRKYVRWVVGSGLKLQAEPIEEIIAGAGGNFNKNDFVKQTEVRFKLWSKSKRASHDKQMSLNRVASEIKKHAVVGGDCVVYLRTDDKGNVTVQLIDGVRVTSPLTNSAEERADIEAGRKIKYGIVFNPETDEHIAYYVRTSNNGHVRVPARDDNGLLVAFMVYGLRYRIDNCRGIPLHTAVLQTVAQLDRYKEAAVGSAEERAKVVYWVGHDIEGTGENIHQRNIKEALAQGLNKKLGDTQQYWDSNYGDLISQTTNKQVPNLPPGAKLSSLATQNELNFQPFMMGNLIILCATLDMPVEVALSKYDSNFSASRAALKDWEHTLNVAREEFTEDMYSPVYQFWLTMQVMESKIQAQPLIQAISRGDAELFEAVTNARFIGAKVPHIDPLVEVKAERLKLGEAGKNIPLTTPSQAAETLGTGEFGEISERYDNEAGEYLVEEPEPIPAGSEEDDDDGLNKEGEEDTKK